MRQRQGLVISQKAWLQWQLLITILLISACGDNNQSESLDSKIEGEITFNPSPASLANYSAVVQLYDTSIADAAAVLISETDIIQLTLPTLRYTLEFDSTNLPNNNGYSLNALFYEKQSNSGSSILKFASTQNYPVDISSKNQEINVEVNLVSNSDSSGTSVPITATFTGWQSGLSNQQYHVIQNEIQYNDLLATVTLDNTPSQPDFQNQTLVAIFMGYRSTCETNAHVKIRDFHEHSDELIAAVVFTQPAGICLPNIPTSGPYVIAVIDKTNIPISFSFSK